MLSDFPGGQQNAGDLGSDNKCVISQAGGQNPRIRVSQGTSF